MHATESGFQDSPAVEAHRLSGMTLTAIAFIFWLMRLRPQATLAGDWPDWARSAKLDQAYARIQPFWGQGGKLDRFYDKTGWIIACVVTFIMMSVTGHLGGNLTHGETYLVQYAPKPIRRLVGLSSETDPRPAPKDLASADIYLDIVAPALHARCDACHNDGKKSGGLSIANYEALMKGGKIGAVIKPGDQAGSNLFHRITLPSNSADYMPKDGKTPLTAEQTAAVGVWIAAGAPKTALVGSLKLTDAQKAILQKALGLGGGDAAAADSSAAAGGGKSFNENANLPKVQPGDAAAVKALESTGFIVRPVAADSNLLDVDFTVVRDIGPADFANLKKIGPQILRLNLRRSGVTDAQLKELAAFPNLRHLRMEGTPVTDAGLPALAALKALNNLSLAQTKVTDAGLATLATLPNLHRVYVWSTGVTAAGVAKLKAAKPDLVVYAGLTRADVPPPGPLVQPVN